MFRLFHATAILRNKTVSELLSAVGKEQPKQINILDVTLTCYVKPNSSVEEVVTQSTWNAKIPSINK